MRTGASVAIGPFRLQHQVGSGGMGAVYRGTHRRDGRAVALKVMTSELAARESYQTEFRREVQALAKLHHPSVARVVDYGVVSGETADAAPEAFVEGAPWFAMEFVEGEPLPDVAADWKWERVEQFLTVLLDALAHAHANEVVHRDLKPSNILVTDVRPRDIDLKLVDFGIAHVFDMADSGTVERAPDTWGTPEVMAPEQIRGEWREQGPWTDLYAVGCVAWWLVCREIPFSGKDRSETYLQHMSGASGSFEPAFDVPGGLEEWVRGMLAIDRRARFQRAADAAYALVRVSQLSGEVPEATPGVRETGEFAPDSRQALDAIPSTDEGDVLSEADGIDGRSPESNRATPESVSELAPPPIPSDWERTEPAVEEPAPDAGLSLFDLRKIPLVDRRSERDRLWRALRAVEQTQQPVARLLRGPAGSGKSRLADWVARRGHELGVLQVMKATHSPKGGPRDGLGPMLARQFRCADLDWSDGFERVREVCESLGLDRSTGYHDAVGLARMMGLADDNEAAPPGFQNPRERHLALRRLLAAAAAERPVMLWLDDVAWGWESARFAEFLLCEQFREPLPILVVMTARDNAIEERPRVSRMLETVCDHEFGDAIAVPPLDRESHRELVEQLLHMDEALVEDVIARTEGHPLFAIQIVGDWVERGILEAGSEGFVLRADAEGSLPDGPHDLWKRRIDQLLASIDEELHDESRMALEIAAALGRHVDGEEWKEVCRRAGVGASERLVERLAEYGLVERDSVGWSFEHSMVTESLEREARNEGRWHEWHRLCAEVIEDLYPVGRPETASRRAEHLVEAEEYRAALEPLLAAVRGARRDDRVREQRQYLERYGDLVESLGLGLEDRAGAHELFERAALAREDGNQQRANAWLERVERAARDRGWGDILGDTLRLRSQVAHDNGRLERARELAAEAEEAFAEEDDPLGRARCQLTRAKALVFLGEFDDARAAFRLAKSLFQAHEQTNDVLETEVWITYTFIYTGEYRSSRERARDVLERAREVGDKSHEAEVWNQLGECARFEREWGEARRYYRRAVQEYEQLGIRGASIAKMNMALVEVPAGRFRRARRELHEVAEELETIGLRSRLPHVYLGLVGAAAGLGEWDRFDDHLETVEREFAETELVRKDTAWLAQHAGRVTAERGDPGRARRLYEMAKDVWSRLGSDERVAEIDEILDAR